MNYLEWNNTLAEYLFNDHKIEKEVFLFITIDEVVDLGQKKGVGGTKKEVFKDVLESFSPVFHNFTKTPHSCDILSLCSKLTAAKTDTSLRLAAGAGNIPAARRLERK